MEPQVSTDGSIWTASYPGADWSVSGRSSDANDDPLAYADDVYRRHLREPVDGVCAVDNELYRELVHAPATERDRAVKEAERRRRLGQTYTLAEYLDNRT